MKLVKAFAISAALLAGSTIAALAQSPSSPPGGPKSPNMSPPGTELPAPNTGVQTPNQQNGSVGSRPMGPPAQIENDLKSPTTPDLKKLDQQGRGGQQQ